MPELPEVELVRRGLAATIVGRRVEAGEACWPGTLTTPPVTLARAVIGRRVSGVTRRGKVLIVELDHGWHLLVHPMMTGQFVVTEGGRTLFAGGHPSRSMLEPMPNQTTRVVVRLSGDRTLFFNDARKFGRIRLLDSKGLAADAFLRRLGPDPLGDAFTLEGFRSQLKRHRRAPIKAVLLNQSVLAGVGNIYADEALHLARVHPVRLAGGLDGTESRRVHHAIRRIVALAIGSGGTSVVGDANRPRTQTGYRARARVFGRLCCFRG